MNQFWKAPGNEHADYGEIVREIASNGFGASRNRMQVKITDATLCDFKTKNLHLDGPLLELKQ